MDWIPALPLRQQLRQQLRQGYVVQEGYVAQEGFGAQVAGMTKCGWFSSRLWHPFYICCIVGLMSEFSLGNGEDSDSKKDSKKRDDTSVRSIGAFAKFTTETPKPPSRREIEMPALREILLHAEEDEKDKSKKAKKSEKTADFKESDGDKKARQHEALKEHITEKREKNRAVIESTRPGSPDHVAAVEADEFEDKLKKRIDNPEDDADIAVEEEYQKRMAAIEAAEPENEGKDAESDTDDAADLESEEETAVAAQESDGEEDNDLPATTAPITSPLGSASTPAPSHSGSRPTPPAAPPSGKIPPAAPPLPPLPPQPPAGSPSHSGAGGNTPNTPRGTGGGGHNAAPSLPNTLSSPNSHLSNERSEKAGAFLVGGILGYMIGRRGGRKRTERRLNPEIKDLQQKLETTKNNLEQREEAIKKTAANKLRDEQAQKQQERIPASAQRQRPISEILRQTVVAPERVKQTESSEKPEELKAAPERPTEQILPPLQKPETLKTAPQAEKKPSRHIENLSTPELLSTAEALFIEGTSVRRLYETNQIDRRGLVAIVQEALKGGNISHVFEKVELGRERQAERAREFRHDDPGFSPLTDDSQSVSPASSAQSLPNSPDATTLRPLNIANESPDTEVHSPSASALQPEESQKPEKLRLDPKTAEFKFAAVAAIAIAALIIWAILS